MVTTKVLYILGHSTIGLLLSLIHILHVSTLFENQTKFSHLSGLERELSLSPQEAFYYQFYKRLITANSMEDGINSLINDNLTQYDEVLTINSLRRFHIMPEVVLAFLYRNFMSLANSLNIPTVNCYYVEPDENSKIDDPKVFVNCDGLGEAIYFYLAIIWSLSAITVFLLYMYGYFLHRNFVAGCAVIVYFFCTHESATNIHRTPMSRHNFAIPFIIWQTFYLNLYVDRHIFSNDNNRHEGSHHRNYAMITSLVIFSTIANLCWEMSSNIFLAQTLAIFLVLQIQNKNGIPYISSGLVFDFAVTQVISNCLCYFLMYGNIKFLISGNMSTNIALIVYLVRMKVMRLPTEEENANFRSPYKRFFYVLFFFLSTSWFIQDLMDRFAPYGQSDNTSSYHIDLIFSMLHLKLPNFYSLLTYYKDNSHDLINVVTLRILHARRRKIDEDALEMQERAKNYVIEDFLETNRITMKDLSDPKTEKKIQENLEILEACNYDYQLFQRRKTSKKIDLKAEKAIFLNDIKKLKTQIQRGEKSKHETAAKLIEACSSNDDDSQRSTEDEKEEQQQKDFKINKNIKKERPEDNVKDDFDSPYQIQPHYAFVLIQTAVIGCIGLRFVLTPFLCLISATLPARSWFKKTSVTSYWIFYMFLVACTFNYPGLKSLRYQYEYKNEFRNPELESLIGWIEKTDQNAVFAAPIELSAHLLLTTKRPITNHPLIEYPDMIERTKSLYSIFSKRQSTEVYNQLVKLRVQFVVIPYESCFLSSKDGVRLIDIFDYIEPENYDKKAFCVSLFQKTNPTFLKVFENVKYIVIQIFSQSIQLELKKKSFPEFNM
ncbi:hypothetical protein PVAND_003653 [Polypedilum vanderplanki]|uniref:Uncharacterized protein n=1 Tax=Polypedilum vanderplanki TaxID=319348 RepID=A0A9J6BV87_POLVA|nr:hypothetical protein PVAND_003653 [Polypedilum vanderplanki]